MVEWTIAESRQLLAQIVDLAAEFSWLYDFHGTQILDCGVLESLPPGWRSTLSALDSTQLNEIAECRSRSEYPVTMQKFLQSCHELSIHQLLPDFMNESLPEWKGVGVGQKKRYEVPRLAQLLEKVRQRTLSRVVLDIGSGLGYVDTMLHHELGFRVVGVESELQRVVSARGRHIRLCGEECQNLQYLSWKLDDDKETVLRASAVVEQLVDPKRNNLVCKCFTRKNSALFTGGRFGQSASTTGDPGFPSVAGDVLRVRANDTNESFGLARGPSETADPVSFNSNPVDESVTLLGLHACADLSPIMIRIFMCCNKISSMVLLSCCYHKLKPAKFENSSQECCSRATEDDPDTAPLSETSESYESDISEDCNKPNCPSHKRPKRSPSSKNSFKSRSKSRQSRRRSSDPMCLFKNFPLSRSGSLLMCKREFSLSVYGLRLACQEPGSRWRHMGDAEHLTHRNALLFRAVLDSVCAKHGVNLVKKKRKCANKDQLASFEDYLTSVLNCYDVKSSSRNEPSSNYETQASDEEHSPLCADPTSEDTDPSLPLDFSLGRLDTPFDSFKCSSPRNPNQTLGWDTEVSCGHNDSSQPSMSDQSNTQSCSGTSSTDDASLSRLVPALRLCYRQNEHLGSLLEAITGLQLAMQGVLESFVLLDRVLYALESKFCSSVQLIKVFDAAVSPRCAALVLYK